MLLYFQSSATEDPSEPSSSGPTWLIQQDHICQEGGEEGRGKGGGGEEGQRKEKEGEGRGEKGEEKGK